MEFIDLVKLRQSVRQYDSRPVEQEKINLCLEAARLSPSAGNSQPWHFIVVDDPALKKRIAEATFNAIFTFNRFTLEAPVMVVMVIEKPDWINRLAARLKERDFKLIDSGIAVEHFCLQAAELGLGTCMLGWFDQQKIKKELQIPEEKLIPLLIALGYPLEDYRVRTKSRKSIGKIAGWNGYNPS